MTHISPNKAMAAISHYRSNFALLRKSKTISATDAERIIQETTPYLEYSLTLYPPPLSQARP